MASLTRVATSDASTGKASAGLRTTHLFRRPSPTVTTTVGQQVRPVGTCSCLRTCALRVSSLPWWGNVWAGGEGLWKPACHRHADHCVCLYRLPVPPACTACLYRRLRRWWASSQSRTCWRSCREEGAGGQRGQKGGMVDGERIGQAGSPLLP